MSRGGTGFAGTFGCPHTGMEQANIIAKTQTIAAHGLTWDVFIDWPNPLLHAVSLLSVVICILRSDLFPSGSSPHIFRT
jgi:hypothetical protein